MKAQHRKTNKLYAIKHINEVSSTAYNSKKVAREVLIMNYLSSIKDNVYSAKLHDIIIPPVETKDSLDFNSIFLVQDYCGMDLKKLIDSGKIKKLNHEHIRIIIYNLLCSLKLLHSANIVHRDIKPGNILIND